jgi:tetratricopeptide (TPR) repeat protein
VLRQALQTKRLSELVLQEAVLRMQLHDYEGARVDAEEVLKSHPDNAYAARIVVGAYVGLNEQHKAIQRLTEIVGYRPKSAALQHLLGEWQFRKGDLAEARKAFEAAKMAEPGFLQADLALAEVDLRENQPDAARQRLKAIVAANPQNVSALLLLAGAETASGNPAGAVVLYRSVLNLDGSNLIALNNLAWALAVENTDEALKLAQQAADIAPDDANVQDTLGWVYYHKGIYGVAINHLKTAVDKGSTAKHQFHLAMCYLKSGQRELGQQILSAALAKDPNLLKTESGW